MSEYLKVNLGNYDAELEIKDELGKGAFGSVHLAIDNRGKPFAVKISECINAGTYYTAAQEIQILMKLKHNNIARMYAFDFHKNKAILVMEFCAQGNLNSRLNQPVNEPKKLRWLTQLLNAMIYLHSHKIVHRDLKPENVLLNDFGEIKISDFGISRYYFNKDEGTTLSRNNLSEYVEAFMGTFAGTPYWVAPEVFDRKYTERADVFSLGVVFYAIIARQFIQHEDVKYYGAFVKYHGTYVGIGLVMCEQEKNIPMDFNRLNDNKDSYERLIIPIINQMLQYVPEQRITLNEALHRISDIGAGSLKRTGMKRQSQYFEGDNSSELKRNSELDKRQSRSLNFGSSSRYENLRQPRSLFDEHSGSSNNRAKQTAPFQKDIKKNSGPASNSYEQLINLITQVFYGSYIQVIVLCISLILIVIYFLDLNIEDIDQFRNWDDVE